MIREGNEMGKQERKEDTNNWFAWKHRLKRIWLPIPLRPRYESRPARAQAVTRQLDRSKLAALSKPSRANRFWCHCRRSTPSLSPSLSLPASRKAISANYPSDRATGVRPYYGCRPLVIGYRLIGLLERVSLCMCFFCFIYCKIITSVTAVRPFCRLRSELKLKSEGKEGEGWSELSRNYDGGIFVVAPVRRMEPDARCVSLCVCVSKADAFSSANGPT